MTPNQIKWDSFDDWNNPEYIKVGRRYGINKDADCIESESRRDQYMLMCHGGPVIMLWKSQFRPLVQFWKNHPLAQHVEVECINDPNNLKNTMLQPVRYSKIKGVIDPKTFKELAKEYGTFEAFNIEPAADSEE